MFVCDTKLHENLTKRRIKKEEADEGKDGKEKKDKGEKTKNKYKEKVMRREK